MAPLTEDDRTLIRILRIEKHLNAYQMMNEFPARNWNKINLNRLIRQIDASASSKRKPVIGRPRSARIPLTTSFLAIRRTLLRDKSCLALNLTRTFACAWIIFLATDQFSYTSDVVSGTCRTRTASNKQVYV